MLVKGAQVRDVNQLLYHIEDWKIDTHLKDNVFTYIFKISLKFVS